MQRHKDVNRREFVSQTGRRALVLSAAATLSPWAKILGANDRIRLGVIGPGGRGRQLLRVAQAAPNVEITAVCDVYPENLEKAAQLTGGKAQTFTDYKELLDSNQIDGVIIGTPDHWHMPMIIDGVRAGKDVYCEKPMTHRLEEGPKIIQAVKKSGRVVQIGTQHRSWDHFIRAGEIVASGRLGKITMATTWWYQNPSEGYRQIKKQAASSAPQGLDWEKWLGTAPRRPFDMLRFRQWRFFWDYGGGGLTDLLTHLIDTVQWYMGESVPVSAMALGGKYELKDWDCPDTVTAAFEYAGGFSVNYSQTYITRHDGHSIVLRGTQATLVINRTQLAVYDEGSRSRPRPLIPGEIEQGGRRAFLIMKAVQDGTYAHMRNFLECMRSRKQPNATVTAGHQGVLGPHLANISYREGRKVRWDAAQQPPA